MSAYSDCMDEINGEELYKGLFVRGMFSEKLIPIFTAKPFFDYCLDKNINNIEGAEKSNDYVSVRIMRNNNVPRVIGIPNPVQYLKLCAKLRDHWDQIKAHFQAFTGKQRYKVSRIHIRKYEDTDVIFKMNYNHWRTDDKADLDLLKCNRYVVRADISNCFAGIYTHSICWALATKEIAKRDRNDGWFNEIDKACQSMKNQETHGLLIGPHASNLLSEIILTVVDHNMSKWNYVRHIDDYVCYVESHEKAEQFIAELSKELANFDLSLNANKTTIKESYIVENNWDYKLGHFQFLINYSQIKYPEMKAYFELVLDLMKNDGNNLAVINYAVKVLKNYTLTDNAKEYFSKRMMNLASIFSYLLPLMDVYVFKKCKVDRRQIQDFSEMILKNAMLTNNYEAVCYAIYFSIEYCFKLKNINLNWILESDDCLMKLCAWLYFKFNNQASELETLKATAEKLLDSDFYRDRNWLFIYEALSAGKLKYGWQTWKKNGISFLLPKYR